MKEFLLMRKDDIIASVQLVKNEYGISELKLNAIFNKDFLPHGLKSANNSNFNRLLNDWNDYRCIPLGRPNYAAIAEEHGILSQSDLLPLSYMCSLTDSYWFKTPHDSSSWADVNFHKNGFSSNLYKSLFYGDNSEPINHFNSPDVTTDGALPKMWQQNENGEFILYKANTTSSPTEACCEVVADVILGELGIEHVPYWLVEDNGIILSACASFINSDTEEFVSTMNLMRDYGFNNQFDMLCKLKELGFGEDVDCMCLGDSILGNIDRHARNYGVIIDADTHQIKRFCPLFDHGGSYIFGNHGYLPYPPTDMTFNKTIQSLNNDVLCRIEKINTNNILNTIKGLPTSSQEKDILEKTLVDRIDKITSFIERQEHDIDRK